MPRFDTGVRYYTLGHVEMDVPFPEDAVCCRYCPFLRADAGGVRHKCVLTGRVVYGLDWRPEECPIIIKEEDVTHD